MGKKLKVLRRFAATSAFPALGVSIGLALGYVYISKVSGLDAHGTLAVVAPDRLYVTKDCQFSARAVELLAATPGVRPVVTIPLDAEESPERDLLCGPAVATLRRDGGFWWRLLPAERICTQLAVQARAWLTADNTENLAVPAWVVGGELAAPGLADDNLVQLRSEGLLGAELASPGT